MSPWASVTKQEALRRTSEMAEKKLENRCTTSTSSDADRKNLLRCLRNQPAAKLTEAQERFDEIY